MVLRAYGRLPRRVRTFAVRRVAPPFRVGAMCVVERDDGSVLLLRNSYRKNWGLPGGLLRRGEEVDAAARREVREETGISVELAGPPGVIVDAGARRVDVVFRARPLAGAAAAPSSPEIVEARWFSPDELPAMQKESAAALRLAGDPDGGG